MTVNERSNDQRRSEHRRTLFPVAVITNAITMSLLIGCSHSASNSNFVATSSGPAAASRSSSSSEPCSLITQSEVEAAVGKGATMVPNHNVRTGFDECRVKGTQGSGIDEVIIIVHSADGWDAVKKAFVDGKDIKEVSGLGDDGFNGRFMGYNARKGNKYVQVFGSMLNESKANEKATRYLAEKAVSRL